MTTMDPVAAPIPLPGTVAGDGFALRPWRMADLAALERWADEELTVAWSPLRRGTASVGDWLAKRCVWDDHMSWAVVDLANEVIGGMSVFAFDFGNGNAQIGYWTAPPARGRGVAGRAARLAAEFAFTALPLERIALMHAVENRASCRAATRAGFILEGTTRQSWRYADGQLHDEHLHALLREDLTR